MITSASGYWSSHSLLIVAYLHGTAPRLVAYVAPYSTPQRTSAGVGKVLRTLPRVAAVVTCTCHGACCKWHAIRCNLALRPVVRCMSQVACCVACCVLEQVQLQVRRDPLQNLPHRQTNKQANTGTRERVAPTNEHNGPVNTALCVALRCSAIQSAMQSAGSAGRCSAHSVKVKQWHRLPQLDP